MVIAFLSGG